MGAILFFGRMPKEKKMLQCNIDDTNIGKTMILR